MRAVKGYCSRRHGPNSFRLFRTRIAEPSRQLIQICCVVNSTLIDNEQVYSLRVSNDRLLLGLNGTGSTTWPAIWNAFRR